jgi:Synergist-CTERM protein sorting domain-containing protein
LTITPNQTAKTITVTGPPTGTGTETFYISGSIDNNPAPDNEAYFTISVTAAGQPTLTGATLSGLTVGTAVSNRAVTITASPSSAGAVRLITVTPPTTPTGLTFARSSVSDDVVLVSGTPTVSGSYRVDVAGTAGTTSNVTGYFMVTISAATTPAIALSPTTLSLTTTSSAGGSITITPTGGSFEVTGLGLGDAAAAGNISQTWNGLTVAATDDRVTVTGRPTVVGSQRFTVYGDIGSTRVSATFTISVTDGTTPPTTTYFQSSSNWSKWRAGNSSIYVNLPVTAAFVTRFDEDGDGRVTTDEISRVRADVSSSYATLNNADDVGFTMLYGAGYGDYGTLQVLLNFTPASGHTNDWYTGLILRSLSIEGENGQTASADLGSSGLSFNAIKDARTGSSSGCDTGLGFSGILLLAPFVLRKKK